jgi:hypothetical protein
MIALFAPLVSWIFRTVVIKFVVITALFSALALLIPMAVNYLTPYLAPQFLTTAFSGIGSGVWWFLDFFALDFGIPMLLSAYITRFLIRRIPLIG